MPHAWAAQADRSHPPGFCASGRLSQATATTNRAFRVRRFGATGRRVVDAACGGCALRPYEGGRAPPSFLHAVGVRGNDQRVAFVTDGYGSQYAVDRRNSVGVAVLRQVKLPTVQSDVIVVSGNPPLDNETLMTQ